MPIQKNGNDLEVSLLNHHWDLAGTNVIQLLLKSLASFDICDDPERWPVELAVLCDCKKEVEMLLPLTSPIPIFPNVRNYYRCMSEADASAVPSFLIDTTGLSNGCFKFLEQQVTGNASGRTSVVRK